MCNKEYRPTLAQLRTFVTIAEIKHFGTAANKLEISQPSLSQALVALEQGLNVQLIERSTRKVIVTSAGETLLPFAKATLEAAEDFMLHAHGAHGTLTGPLTIGIIPTIAPYILPQLLKNIKQSYPELSPRVVEGQTISLLEKLKSGQLDLAIMALPSEAPGMEDLHLYDERFCTIARRDHPLAGRTDLELADLNELGLLLLDDGHCLRDQILDLCRNARISTANATNSVTRASSLTTIVQLVRAGLGTTLVPESALATELRNSDLLVGGFAPGIAAYREVGLVYRNSAARRAEYQRFGSLVTDAFENATAQNSPQAGQVSQG